MTIDEAKLRELATNATVAAEAFWGAMPGFDARSLQAMADASTAANKALHMAINGPRVLALLGELSRLREQVAAARADALADAIAACERVADDMSEYSIYRGGASACVAAIRALKDAKETTR